MPNISKFIKNHVPLCVCTLGIGILCYLGYRGVKWVISKCLRTQKIDHTAQKNIGKQEHILPKPLIDRVNLGISQDEIIKMGQGDYIVFYQTSKGEKKDVDKETFDKVYNVVCAFSPAAILERGSENMVEECVYRYQHIKAKLHEIDARLKIIFVPRTLMELIFLRKCINEDIKNDEICPFLSRMEQLYIYHPESSIVFKNEDPESRKSNLGEIEMQKRKRKCWHLCYFDDAGDNEHADVKKVAYRLNKAVIKTLSPTKKGFSHKEFSSFLEKEISFLKAHYLRGPEAMARLDAINKDAYNGTRVPGPTLNFGYEFTCDKPMGIRNENDAQIIRNALALDCSAIAQKAFILYRGADFQRDSCLSSKDSNIPYSLSFGTSLFAGSLFDAGASAFPFMRNSRNGYAIAVPFEHFKESIFYIPPTNTLAQLYGDGEAFHGRTKAWKDFDLTRIAGIRGGNNCRKRDHLQSNLAKEDFIAQFQEYKSKALQLK
ncbi:hypothetical protein PHSC3_000415 [Chlamydiales bacterium STE3]|nr:hypothetical protein PHSC3_000415 [Chlamydiales bacterium STE3]